MEKKLRVGVIFGGRSGEHEISVLSARTVIQGFDPERYEVVPLAIDREGRWLAPAAARAALEAGSASPAGESALAVLPSSASGPLVHLEARNSLLPVDVVFPVLHGPYGEDGTIQGLFEMAGIPYVGAGVSGSAVGMDKALMKALWRAHGLPVLPCAVALRSRVEANPEGEVRRLLQQVGLPCFVKPANLGSSLGISRCTTAQELRRGLEEAARFDRKMVVEASAEEPREIEVGVLGGDDPEATVPGEVEHDSVFYDYRTKYLEKDRSRIYIPARLEPERLEEARRLALAAWRALDLNGMCRVDLFLDARGELWLNEVNTIPGFTPASMFARLWEASGLPFPRLLDRLVELALERFRDRRRNLTAPPVLTPAVVGKDPQRRLSMSVLAEKKCRPCEGGVDPMSAAEAHRMAAEIPGWKVDGDTLVRDLTFKNFREAVAFVNRVAELAEEENHHPDLLIHGYRSLRITLTTHAIGGLSENDFILAAKIERLQESRADG